MKEIYYKYSIYFIDISPKFNLKMRIFKQCYNFSITNNKLISCRAKLKMAQSQSLKVFHNLRHLSLKVTEKNSEMLKMSQYQVIPSK